MKLDPFSSAFELAAPVASVILDTSRDTEGAAAALQVRWKDIDRELDDLGCPQQVRDALAGALEAAVEAALPLGGRHGHALFGGSDGQSRWFLLPKPPATSEARWSAVPHVEPLVAQWADETPYVVVRTDRTGADIGAGGPGLAEQEHIVEHAHDPHIQKVHVGGWAHLQYQRHSENIWEDTAVDVAEEVARVASSIGARVIVTAGDVHARRLLRDHLPAKQRELVADVDEGGRAAGADSAALEETVTRLRAHVAASDAREAVDRARAAGNETVAGLGGVTDALRSARADALLVWPGAAAGRSLWVGESPEQLGRTPDEVAAFGGEGRQTSALDALLRTAAWAGTEVTFVYDGAAADDGLEVVLRGTSA